MSENIKEELLKETEQPAVSENDTALQTEPAAEPPKRGLDGVYENFRDVPLKYVDRFIGICVALLVAVILLGIFQARL